jgi:hypothetical protein
MNPRVKAVVAKDDYKLEIEFANGEIGVYDCAPLLEFGVFQELRDIDYFKQARAEGGTVAWPHEQDICPDTLYEDAKKLVAGDRR